MPGASLHRGTNVENVAGVRSQELGQPRGAGALGGAWTDTSCRVPWGCRADGVAGRGGPGPSGLDPGGGGVEAVRRGGPGWSRGGGGDSGRLEWRRWVRSRREGGGACRPVWDGGVGEGTFPGRQAAGRGSESPPEAAPASWPSAWRSRRATRFLLPNPAGGNGLAAQSFVMRPPAPWAA